MYTQFTFDDRSQAEFFSGETINGRVVLKIESEHYIQGAYISFCGGARTSFTTSYSKGRYTKRIDQKEQQQFVNARTKILDWNVLAIGTHMYNFSIPIPTTCVTSCHTSKGVISYRLMLSMEMSEKDEVFTRDVTVVQPLNLNSDPVCRVPLKQEDIKYICCYPRRSGPICTELSLPVGGFVPGQEIPYELKVQNHSVIDLKGYKVMLVQRGIIKENTILDRVLVLVQCGEVILHGTTALYAGKLRVPPVPPTTLPSLKSIIRLEYLVAVAIKTGLWHWDIKFVLPIAVGTKPLLDNAESILPACEMRSETEAFALRYPVYLDYPLPRMENEPYLAGSMQRPMSNVSVIYLPDNVENADTNCSPNDSVVRNFKNICSDNSDNPDKTDTNYPNSSKEKFRYLNGWRY